MIKILAVGDPHSKRTNQSELLACGTVLQSTITEQKPNAVVILGDLANDHEKLYVSALNGIVKFLSLVCDASASIGAKVYYIIGNHDAVNNQIFLTDDHSFNAFKRWPNLIIVDKPLRLKSQEGHITMCPYVPPTRLVDALDTMGRDKWMESMVIFCHQEFMDAQFGHIKSKTGDVWGPLLPLAVSGHVHGYNRLASNILYIGTPYDISFGEDGEKTVSLLSFEGGQLVSQDRINLGLPKKLTVHLKACDVLAYEKPENANVRMYISATTQEFAKLKSDERFHQLSKVVKMIPQITDPVKVVKNINRKGYIDILIEECAKENVYVQDVLKEISQNGAGK